ncbi:histidine phosphatase family protein [Pseudomonas benzenivorans]|uniref:Histidine phosphatase family protein n=1 Tax=Pseudomonas benzenivorans TaxID=556533 RepID=A0ABY5H8J6_9PSED|nr:histidine phosphatase family protein [Pseudomonas benzenivorans]UTW07953.1 histidine phosphatase family protein [Pseudomonas benzenivorans]
MGSIYLIRHGQASFGAADYDVLSPTGVRQAEVLGAHLAQLGLHMDRSISGTLRRQQHTATTTMSQLGDAGLKVPALELDAAFNEFDADAVIRALLPGLLPEEPGALQVLRDAAQNRAEFQRLFALLISRWLSGEYDQPGLQSWQGFVEQVQEGFSRLLEKAERGQNIALFTSGGTITALLHLVTGVAPTKAFELNWQIVNTSLSCLKFRGTQVSLASFNSHVHLQLLRAPELITFR